MISNCCLASPVKKKIAAAVVALVEVAAYVLFEVVAAVVDVASVALSGVLKKFVS
jgi:hypothetical protein